MQHGAVVQVELRGEVGMVLEEPQDAFVMLQEARREMAWRDAQLGRLELQQSRAALANDLENVDSGRPGCVVRYAPALVVDGDDRGAVLEQQREGLMLVEGGSVRQRRAAKRVANIENVLEGCLGLHELDQVIEEHRQRSVTAGGCGQVQRRGAILVGCQRINTRVRENPLDQLVLLVADQPFVRKLDCTVQGRTLLPILEMGEHRVSE